MTFRRLLFLYGALDSHPFFPSHVASGRCLLSAAAAGGYGGGVRGGDFVPTIGMGHLIHTSLQGEVRGACD